MPKAPNPPVPAATLQRLRRWMKKHDLTQHAVADMLGCTRERISQILRCEPSSERPGRALAIDIEALTGIAVDDWYPKSKMKPIPPPRRRSTPRASAGSTPPRQARAS